MLSFDYLDTRVVHFTFKAVTHFVILLVDALGCF